MAWVAVISINCLCHVTFHSLIWPSRRVGNFGYTIWMIATMLGLLASCSLGNDLRCRYSIEMPSLLKRMNQTQLPSKYKHFCQLQRPDQGSLTLTRVVRQAPRVLVITKIFSFYAGKSIDRNDQYVNENYEAVVRYWLRNIIKLSYCTLLCKSYDY